MRTAVVTPYFQETPQLLERCIRSVREQTLPADHILIADGHPQRWIDDLPVRHITLDKAHANYGGTPRAIGALLAIADRYDAICFLDGDNWYELDHVACCLEAARLSGPLCDYVIARIIHRRPDETIIPFDGECIDSHVDTSCYMFLSGAFHMLPIWGLTPQIPSQAGDRFFYSALKQHNLKRAVCQRKTVNYHSLWEPVYRAVGEDPPPNSKPFVDQGPLTQWRQGLTTRERVIAGRLMQLNDL